MVFIWIISTRIIEMHIQCRHDRDRMVVGFITIYTVSITTNVVSPNPTHGEVYSMQ
jgi:hypothetical protein